jgi:ribose transport system substrate-binding protein
MINVSVIAMNVLMSPSRHQEECVDVTVNVNNASRQEAAAISGESLDRRGGDPRQHHVGRLRAAHVVALHALAADLPESGHDRLVLDTLHDDYKLGRMLGQQLETMIPPGMQGTVVLGTSVPGALALDRRSAGVRDWLNRVRPRLSILGPFDTKQDPAASQEAWTTLLRANPYAVAFVGIGDNDAATLARLRASGPGGWLAGGFGLDDMALTAVRTGKFALVSPELYVQGAVAGRLQAAAARGDALPEGWLVTPGLPITAADVPAIRARQASAVRSPGVADELVTDAPAHLRPLEDVQGSLS